MLRGKSKTQRQKELRAKASRIEREERKRKAQEEEGKWSSELAVLRAPLKYQNGIVTRPADDVTFLRAEENVGSAIPFQAHGISQPMKTYLLIDNVVCFPY